jgi:ABC-type lipoprotein export system ATPase subunit
MGGQGQLSQKPCIIAIMGCTGVGKSTFIKTLGGVSKDAKANAPVVGDGLNSCEYQCCQIKH